MSEYDRAVQHMAARKWMSIWLNFDLDSTVLTVTPKGEVRLAGCPVPDKVLDFPRETLERLEGVESGISIVSARDLLRNLEHKALRYQTALDSLPVFDVRARSIQEIVARVEAKAVKAEARCRKAMEEWTEGPIPESTSCSTVPRQHRLAGSSTKEQTHDRTDR